MSCVLVIDHPRAVTVTVLHAKYALVILQIMNYLLGQKCSISLAITSLQLLWMESHVSNCRLCKHCAAGVGVRSGFGILHNALTLITYWAAFLHDRKSYAQPRNEDLILHPYFS